MKRILQTGIVILISCNVFASDGEFIIKLLNVPPGKRIVVVAQKDPNAYAWKMADTVRVRLLESFNDTAVTISNSSNQEWAYLHPYDYGDGGRLMPWTLANINISIYDTANGFCLKTFNETLDFRDKDWAGAGVYQSASWQADTYLECDYLTGSKIFRFKRNANQEQTKSATGNDKIWEIWDGQQNTNGLNPPVYLKNVVEEDATQQPFGFVCSSSDTIWDGSYKLMLTGVVTQGSESTFYNNAKHNSFKWNNSNFVTFTVRPSIYSADIEINTDAEKNEKIVKRIFKGTTPLIIKNVLLEMQNGVADSIFFKDPTIDTLFHTYAASGNGFVMNEAFTYLDEQINGRSHQKYSVKAVPSFTQNNITWNWTGGDFNPTTQTDTLITGPTTLTANYKGSLASNTSTALSLPSQRKIVRGSDGAFYLAYESMGKIWAEYSTDGTTWHLANNGQAIGTGSTPSAVSCGNGIYVVYNNGAGFSLYLVTQYETTKYCDSDNDDYGDVNTPVVSISESSDFIVLWSNSTGIHYNIGNSVTNGPNNIEMLWSVENATLTGTGNSSCTPTVECVNNVFQVAWQQSSGSSSYIDYRPLTRQSDGTYIQGSTTVMSSGLPQNYNPSLIGVSRGPWLCWIGDDPEDSRPVTIFHDQAASGYWYFGFGVTSASINQSSDRYVIGWVNEDGSHEYTDHCHLGNPLPLSSNGSYLQIVNSTSGTTMRSLGFNTGSAPYRFNLSSTIPLYKSTGSSIGKGRGGFITLGGAQFVFLLGDIIAGTQKIDFVDMPDTVQIDGVSSLNNILETKPFTINGSSQLSYGVAYWTADSAMAVAALQGGKNVSFKVEMVDAETGGIIGVFDQCTYTSSQIVNHKNIGYDVNTNGIGTRSVKLRLRVAASSDAEYAVVNAVAKGFALKKVGSEKAKINLMNASVVTAYSLSANYPNPFNPSTQIAYQLKDAGMVRLGVYDMLGREVAVLVNERQESGFYSATWNAGSLSSGSYIYRISVKDENGKSRFSETKRMMLVK